MRTNNLLSVLSRADAAALEPHLQEWWGEAGDVLYEPGDHVHTVYFPSGPALVSYVVNDADGRGVETALIGREGAVGGIVSGGRLPAFARSVVHFGGRFLTVESSRLNKLKEQSESFRSLFARYADCFIAQIFQSVACNATHTIEQRTAKWLLSALDRTGDHDIPLTQEQLAGMLGVGRSYVSRVIRSMKQQEVLETRRGGLRVQSLAKLHKLSCGCDELVRGHFHEVLDGVYPTEEESTALKQDAEAR